MWPASSIWMVSSADPSSQTSQPRRARLPCPPYGQYSGIWVFTGPDAFRASQLGEELCQRLLEVMVLAPWWLRSIELPSADRGRGDQLVRLPVVDVRFLLKEIRAPIRVLKLPDTEARHNLADFLSDEEEVVHDVARVPVEALAGVPDPESRCRQGRCSDGTGTHRARQPSTTSGAVAAKLIRAEHRADHHVAARLDLAVNLDRHTVTEVSTRVCCVSERPRPRRCRCASRKTPGSRRTAVVTRDHDVRLRLGDASRHGADTGFRNELHRDVRVIVQASSDRGSAARDPRSNNIGAGGRAK